MCRPLRAKNDESARTGSARLGTDSWLTLLAHSSLNEAGRASHLHTRTRAASGRRRQMFNYGGRCAMATCEGRRQARLEIAWWYSFTDWLAPPQDGAHMAATRSLVDRQRNMESSLKKLRPPRPPRTLQAGGRLGGRLLFPDPGPGCSWNAAHTYCMEHVGNTELLRGLDK